MKRKNKLFIIMALVALTFCSCNDFFDADSTVVLKTDKDKIETERKALTAMMGILHQFQLIGNNAVIFGELRGDLLDVTYNSSQDLHDIRNFEVKGNNPYLDERNYYAIINNCNYLINLIDTSVVLPNRNNNYVNEKLLQREMGAAKAIRAWSFLQICLNYGSANYFTKPLLEATEDFSAFPRLEVEALCDSLIADLLPWKPADGDPENLPNYGNIDGIESAKMFIPIRFVLGELYLWKKDYANAAYMYYQTIRSYSNSVLTVSAGNDNQWGNSQFTSYGRVNWLALFNVSNRGLLSIIPYTNAYANNGTTLGTMFGVNYTMAPSVAALDIFNSQIYSISADITRAGDLRGYCSYGNTAYGSYTTSTLVQDDLTSYPVVTKYRSVSNYSILCRASLVYLRYAEAVNRMNKPTLAFAVLKYGLNSNTMALNVAPKELTGQNFLEFGQTNATLANAFNSNVGMHSRGSGNVHLNNGFRIPADVDSVQWVEEQIVTEYALETAFEGNRFIDLMRVANHRNDAAFLARTVAKKFPVGEQTAIIQKLSHKNNWYLPEATKE